MFLKLAIRDALLVVLCLYLWSLDAGLRGDGWLLSVPAGLAAGLSTVLVGFVLHEWGHLLGALAARSKVYAPRGLRGLFLFHFDTALNSGRQFVAMSAGGLLVSLVFMVFLIVALPLPTLGGITALTFSGIGLIATLITELPVAWAVGRGAPLPKGPVYEPIEA